jgi:hypothetical protein
MTTRSIVTALVMAVVFTWGDPASAQQSKCLSGKTKCMSKKGVSLLKCEQLAETPGKAADPNAKSCVTKAKAKFDGGTAPAKGCFEKLENKKAADCVTVDDTGAAEAAVDSCVGAFVAAIDPPPITQTKCGAGKKKCVSKYLAALLKCHQLAQKPGQPTDPNAGGCVDKATAKYTGGADPTKGCFAKLEAKSGTDCQAPTGNSGTVQGLVDDCVAGLITLVTQTTPTTTSTTTSTLPAPGLVLKGALGPTHGRFNYNLMLGLPGANAACNTNFPGTHACTYPELQNAETAGDLVGLKDVAATTVTSFWVIDASSSPSLTQCLDDVSSNLNWEYATAHTASRGTHVDLANPVGTLGAVSAPEQCNFTNRWVGCCQ